MKTLYTYIGLFILALTVFSACADDAEFQGIEKVESDFVTLNLNYKSQEGKEIEVSRSAASAAEKKLYDLHFYVFDAKGKLTGYEKVISTGDDDVIEEAPQIEKVSIRAKSGESYIYAVANINESSTYYLDQADKDLLNIDRGTTDDEYRVNIEESQLTRDKFLNIRFKRLYGNEGQLFSPDPVDNVFVMSGYVNDGSTVNIPKGTSVALPEGQNIVKLYRILAKNTFTVASGTAKGKFTPKYFRLCNVPTSGLLIPNAGISTTSNYLVNNVTNAEVESSYQWNFEGNSEITFYFPENLQKAKNNSITEWKNREKNTWNNGAKTFTNAADNAAYIEIYGDFVDHSGSVTANVNYTVHFGDFSSSGALTDFNVIRNHDYKYKVTIDGVDDIKVEAQTTTGEDNPYAEGLIIDATKGKHFDVDAHYEARVMTFQKSTIEDLRKNGSGYILNIKTPFGETKETVNVKSDGVYAMNGQKLCDLNNPASIFNNEADYQWIKFVRNTTDNRMIAGADISKNVCKYPGDGMQYGKWLNVFELLAELYNDATYTDNGGTEAYYTCFIDENYYANKTWPEYVDKDSRSLLIANELDISADKKSLYASVAYSISQRSISTFYVNTYKPNGTDLVKAFGTEIIDEEKVYDTRFDNNDFNISDNYQVDWNARTSAMAMNRGVSWFNSTNAVEGMQPLYSTVAKACMSRNRDLDGNGTISDGEVKWYLAAVGQYRALILGQNALDADAYLINRDELTDINQAWLATGRDWNGDSNGHAYRGRYHYFTTSSGDKRVFWPEESLTTGPLGGGYSYAELVRCIRTLESGGQGLTEPELFYTYEDNTFDLGGIVATRNYTEAPLGGHNEIEASNNLYSSFVVAEKDLMNTNNNYNFTTSNITGSETDYCSNYAKQRNVVGTDEANYSWRTPNQKEFALMLLSMPEMANYDYGIRTRFSGDDTPNGYWEWHDTPGFWSDNGRINVGSAWNNSVRIRCVRDKK